MSLDKFFDRAYHQREYNCGHFVCEVWRELTGQDVSGPLRGFLAGAGERKAVLGDLRAFRRLPAPVAPSLVLLQARRTAPHAGVFVNGKVLHIQRQGVQFQPIDVVSFGFDKVGFYKC